MSPSSSSSPSSTPSNPNPHPYYGGNPLAHTHTGASTLYPPFAGYLQPGVYRASKRNIANAAPLGLAGFAATTFVLSLINWHTRDITQPSMVIGPAFAYGGFIQLLAGMWEMAAGNTFAATALSSYGGYWISLAIVLTPGGFHIQDSYTDPVEFSHAFGLFLVGWFVFTFLLWLLTLRSTVVFCSLFFSVWWCFLMLALAYLYPSNGAPNVALQKAGGMFGLVAAFLAWYICLAGIADDSNSFFTVPVWHFPWSEKGRAGKREKSEREKTAEANV